MINFFKTVIFFVRTQSIAIERDLSWCVSDEVTLVQQQDWATS